MNHKNQYTNQKTKTQFQLDNIGKIPPQAVDVEGAILGILMMDKDSYYTTSQYLKPESFYKDSNQKIFHAIKCLYDENKVVDILTVTEKLRNQNNLENCGGPVYVSKLTESIGITEKYQIEQYSMIVAEKFIRRELIRICSEVSNDAYDENVDTQDLIDQNNRELTNIMSSITTGEAIRLDYLINEKILELEKIMTGEIKLTGIPSGFTSLDRITSGWQQSDLIIIAARPSVGKTAISLALAKNASLFNIPVVFFSLEMSSGQLTLRIISSETGFTNMELRQGKINDFKRIDKSLTKLMNKPFYIEDKPALSISQLTAKIAMYVKKYGIKLVIVDYLQLMKGMGEGTREQEISSISRGLKIIAKDHNIPVIALSQLSRAVETRADKKPMLSDLRESGAIEQDADIVIFLRRDEMWFEEPELKGFIQLDIAKHRSGALGEISLKYATGMTEFYDSDHELTMPVNSNFSNDNPF